MFSSASLLPTPRIYSSLVTRPLPMMMVLVCFSKVHNFRFRLLTEISESFGHTRLCVHTSPKRKRLGKIGPQRSTSESRPVSAPWRLQAFENHNVPCQPYKIRKWAGPSHTLSSFIKVCIRLSEVVDENVSNPKTRGVGYVFQEAIKCACRKQQYLGTS